MSSWSKAPPGVLTTGIGSLPHTFVDAALEFSYRFNVPFLPQMPVRNPKEFMITQALEVMPGLVFKEGGDLYLDLEQWERQTKVMHERTESAFRSGDDDAFETFEPSPDTWACWRPFLYEVEERQTSFIKLELAGPMTCQWALRLTNGTPADRHPEVAAQIFRLVLARAIAMCRRVRRTGASCLFFVDEPGFYGFSNQNPRHRIALSELKLFLTTLKKEGVLVGLHCCSNTEWKSVLELPLDVLSIDTNLSLVSLLQEKTLLDDFLVNGRLSLGVVPTGGHSVKTRSYRPEVLFEKLVETLGDRGPSVLSNALLTPACGLALHSITDAEAILDELLEVSDLCRGKWQ